MSRTTDIEILKMFWDEGNPSITEISERVGKSIAAVHGDLVELEQAGLVSPPRKPHAARDRSLTEAGKKYLLENGYVTIQVFD